MSKLSEQSLVSFAKRRGFIYPASEIYGGVAGIYDYGPYGIELKNNLKKSWWDAMVYKNTNVVGLDSAILQHPRVWDASGHTERFSDPMVDCKACKHRFRADKLVDTDSTDKSIIIKKLATMACPNCSENNWTQPRDFNLLVEAYLGAVEGEKNLSYLRGETCQGIYTNFANVVDTLRVKIPFGIAQIGKAFRNEITPGDFLFRQREFEQMEMQFFVNPAAADEFFENWKMRRMEWHTRYIAKENLRFREHKEDERAHYARSAVDIEYNYPFGFREMEGIHNRGDWDLSRHSDYSSQDLSVYDEASGQRYTPYVVETSVGVDRLFMAVVLDAYEEEEVERESRVVLRLHHSLAPVKVAILPLSKKPDLTKLSMSIFSDLAGDYKIEYDETQSIGKRYRRQDEIGTPYCVTVDFVSLEDDMVTVRERDSMKQERIAIAKLDDYLADKLS